MIQLAKAIDNMLLELENANTGLSVMDVLVLDYHISTAITDMYPKALEEVYGMSTYSMDYYYHNLEVLGYFVIEGNSLNFTNKCILFSEGKINKRPKKDIDRLMNGFHRFWSKFPRKVGKKKSKDLWIKLNPTDIQMEMIIESLDRQIKHKQKMKQSNTFTPEFQDPERWIKNERWEDVIEEDKSKVIAIKKAHMRDER
jgi:hypothetical protein